MRHLRMVIVSAVLAVGFSAQPAFGAPANLDSSFGTGGIFSGSVQVLDFGVEDTFVQTDDKIVTVSGSGSPADIRVERFLTNGTPDPAFGGGDGIVVHDLAGSFDYARDIFVLANGKMLLAGNTQESGESRFLVARLEDDGDLDTTFGGGDGWATAEVGYGDSYAYSLARQSDGKIILGGKADGNNTPTIDDDFAFARFSTTGVLDTTFGFASVGWSTQSLEPTPNEGAVKVFVDASTDKIIAAGRTQVGIDAFFGIARFSSTGFIDNTYATSGHTTVPAISTFADIPYDAVMQPDGKIVIAGETLWASGGRTDKDFGVARLNTDGSLDTSFAGDGTTTVDIGLQHDRAFAVTTDECGRIVLAGETGTSRDWAVARLSDAGAPDSSFGFGGIWTQNFFGYDDTVQSVALQPADNRILVSGVAVINGSNSIRTKIARLEGGGSCTVIPPANPPAAPPAAPVVSFASQITSPSYAKKLDRKSSLTIKGTATASNTSIVKVEIALRREVKDKCYWLKSSSGSFKKTSKGSSECSKTTWLTAKGTGSWSYKVNDKLPKDDYRVYARVHLANGTVQSAFVSRENASKFTLR